MDLVRAILALVAAAVRSVGRWCERTRSWVVERVFEPGFQYFGEACSGAAQAAVGFMPDVLRSALKLPGQLLRGTGAVVEGGGRFAGASLSAAAALPGALASGFASARNVPPPPPAPRDRGSADADEVDEAVDDVRSRRGARAALEAMRAEAPAPVSLEARFVHRFACLDRDGRDELDIEELTPELQRWLMSLNDRQLAHLAQSPELCQRAVSGKRTGLIGMPLPEEPSRRSTSKRRGRGASAPSGRFSVTARRSPPAAPPRRGAGTGSRFTDLADGDP